MNESLREEVLDLLFDFEEFGRGQSVSSREFWAGQWVDQWADERCVWT